MEPLAQSGVDAETWHLATAPTRTCPSAWTAWITADGLLTDHIGRAAGGPVTVRVVDEARVTLTSAEQAYLQADDRTAHRRRVVLSAADERWVYAETLIPLATVAAHPWLVHLGNQSLGATLARHPGLRRGPFEYTALQPDGSALGRRAGAALEIPEGVLWARRSWFALGAHRLCVLEGFHPRAVAGAEAPSASAQGG